MTEQELIFSDDEFFTHRAATRKEQIAESSYILRGFALAEAEAMFKELELLLKQAPFRQMQTPGGHTMSVAMTNCGELGWLSDSKGYRYRSHDPLSGEAWPMMPELFRELAHRAAQEAGFSGFQADACLINCYSVGAKMSLHQDKNEHDLSEPIVSVSLGIPAVFLFGGLERSDKTFKHPLFHGDVVVWGGADRLRYHGVMPLKEEFHPLLGAKRINLTFRKAS
ncbi:MAG: DNA oxidative demethylase AlkB [Alcaligenaceae bacterium]|nr:DNA oxidative demethylase AlkB [Alcaligenaceae bacterium]